MIQAIETQYKGYRFRSRLEARWAVFFDALGIVWEYEPEGFRLSDGTPYLPDFHQPTFDGGMWVEVKPKGGDFGKAAQFAEDAKESMWCAEGEPAARAYTCYLSYCDEGSEYVHAELCIPNVWNAEGCNRMFVQPEDLVNEDGTMREETIPEYYTAAVFAARSARF